MGFVWLRFVSIGIPGFSQFSVHREVPASLRCVGGLFGDCSDRVRGEVVHSCEQLKVLD